MAGSLAPSRLLPFYDFDLRASHARTLLPAALASVPFGFVLVRVRVLGCCVAVLQPELAKTGAGVFQSPPPEGGLDLVTNRQGAI